MTLFSLRCLLKPHGPYSCYLPEDGLVEAAADGGAVASSMVTEELMRKMRDELLTEITRTSKMDRIKMTATFKKELAKSKEEQVSITETPPVQAATATTDDLATDFTRVSQVWSLIRYLFVTSCCSCSCVPLMSTETGLTDVGLTKCVELTDIGLTECMGLPDF